MNRKIYCLQIKGSLTSSNKEILEDFDLVIYTDANEKADKLFANLKNKNVQIKEQQDDYTGETRKAIVKVNEIEGNEDQIQFLLYQMQKTSFHNRYYTTDELLFKYQDYLDMFTKTKSLKK